MLSRPIGQTISPRLITPWLFLLLAAGVSAEPSSKTAQTAAPDPIVAIGGLTLIPEAYRYRPEPPPIAPLTANLVNAPLSGPSSGRSLSRRLAQDYHPDRDSLINSIRARRGLALLTFWETAERCLFVGVSDRGFAGINFMSVRALSKRHRGPSQSASNMALYNELTTARYAHDSDGKPLFILHH